MRDVGTPVGPVPEDRKALRDLSSRGNEELARQNALLRAEQVGRNAADQGFDQPAPSAEDVERFDLQARRIGERVETIPHMDALLESEGTRRSDSRRLADSIQSAEQMELRIDEASETQGS